MPHDSEQHAQHDPFLVVSLAAGDLTGADRDLAASLIADCAECATLHADVLAIARATAVIPATARKRDFRLTPEQAARLRPAGWRRFVGAFASPRLAVTRQLGVGLTTLGLAGLLVSVLPTIRLDIGMGSSAGAAPTAPERLMSTDTLTGGAEAQSSGAPSAAAAPAASDASSGYSASQPSPSIGVMAPDRASSSDGNGVTAQGEPQASQAPVDGDRTARQLADAPASQGQGVSLILVASAILLAAGIALLIARRVARGMTGG